MRARKSAVAAVLAPVATAAVCMALSATAEATFPGRNGRVAFSAETTVRFAQNTVLWDYDPATKKVRQLTRRGGGCRETGSNVWVDGGQDYSPDGRWIAYLHGDGCRGGKARTGLWIMRADGRAKRQLNSFQMFDDDPLDSADAAFSSDGRAVAVLSWAQDPRGYYALRVFRVPDGAVQQELFFDGSGIAGGVDWGTNGRLVVSIDGGIHVVSPDGGGERRMDFTRSGGYWEDWAPDWHPRSGTFVFRGTRTVDDRLVGESIFRGFSQKQQAVQLTRGGRVDSPAFSPDGRRIAFIDNGGRILQLSSNGRGRLKTLMRVRARMEWIWSISWQPKR